MSAVDVEVQGVRGKGEVEVIEDVPRLGEDGEVFMQNLPQSSLDVQSELIARRAQLGCDGLVVWVYVEVLAVGGQLLPLWNDDGGLQEGIQRLSVEFNDLTPHPTLFFRAVLRVINFGVKLLH